MRKPHRRLSPAMVVACLALFVAMTGTSIASSYLITSTNQIKPSVLNKLKGAKGPRGLTGPAGAPGAAGAAGAAGATHIIKRVAWDPLAYTLYSSVIAHCNPGEVATGGGADWVGGWGGHPIVSFSVPYPYDMTGGTAPTGWQAEIDNIAGSGYVQAGAWVLCAS